VSLNSRFIIEIQVVAGYVSRKDSSADHWVVRGKKEIGEVEVIVRGILKRSPGCSAPSNRHITEILS